MKKIINVILIFFLCIFAFCGCNQGGKVENILHTETPYSPVITPTAVSTPRHNATPMPAMTPIPTPTVTPTPSVAPEIGEMVDPYIGEMDGYKYLFLPAIDARAYIHENEEPYLSNISFSLVKEFEAEMLGYKDNEYVESGPSFYFKIEENGAVYLCAEVIETIPDAPDGQAGCNIDHRHLFFKKCINENSYNSTLF